MNDPTPRGEASKSKWADPAIRKRIIDGQRAYWNNPDGTPNLKVRKKRGTIAKKALAPKKVRDRISEGTKEAYKDPEVKKNLSNALVKIWAKNTERREQASNRATKVFSDPRIEEKRRLAHATPEARKRISEGNERSWENDQKRKQQVSKWAAGLWAPAARSHAKG